MQGKVKSLVTEKNYGFITPDDGSKDVFFHGSALQGMQIMQLSLGDTVTFDVEQSEKGPRAVNVVRV